MHAVVEFIHGLAVDSDLASPQDLVTTIYHCVGIGRDMELADAQGSDRRPIVPRKTPGIPQVATFDRTNA